MVRSTGTVQIFLTVCHSVLVMKGNPFIPNSNPDSLKRMLDSLGIKSIEDLFSDIPNSMNLKSQLNIPKGLSEAEVDREVKTTLKMNFSQPEYLCFLGGGVWNHYVPAAVDAIVSRSEFYTSYTPYQAEVSQGLLQALYEYQSLICDLTNMDVANSSMYDWASAVGEAARMAVRITKRRRIVVSRNCGPERIETLRTYCDPIDVKLEIVNFNQESGSVDVDQLIARLSNDVAGIYIENPNYFGVFEKDVKDLFEEVHRKGSLAIVGIDPMSLGVIKPPGEYGADIVVGEGQPLGIRPNYGGPLLGILAAKGGPIVQRQMPGRIIGETLSKDGRKRCFAMVMQTREQHIRREEATSNICTNEALCALAAGSYLALLGPSGFRDLGKRIMESSHYAVRRLAEISNLQSPLFNGSFFKDFVVRVKGVQKQVLHCNLIREKILAAFPLGRQYPELGDSYLFSATEVHTKEDIDALVEAVRKGFQ